MTESEENLGGLPPDERTEMVRLLVNEILDRFNQEMIDPVEAGMAILALTHRLLGVLESAPEVRKKFIVAMIHLINSYLSEEVQGENIEGML